MRKLWFAACLLPVVALAAESPFDGTWKIDLDKVQFPDKPETWVLHDGRYQCSTCQPAVDVTADGTDQPTPGARYRDTLAVKVVDAKTVEMTDKKGGKVVAVGRATVSADGKTLSTEFTSYPEASPQPVTGKTTVARVAAGPAGAHAISGSWRTEKVDTVSTNALTFTLKASADGLMSSSATGETYDAKFDGKDYPVKGDRAGAVVSLTKIDDRSIDEATKIGGKVLYVSHMTVSADGKTMTVKSEDKERGTTTTWVATKQ
jgi:hypothetical protein